MNECTQHVFDRACDIFDNPQTTWSFWIEERPRETLFEGSMLGMLIKQKIVVSPLNIEANFLIHELIMIFTSWFHNAYHLSTKL